MDTEKQYTRRFRAIISQRQKKKVTDRNLIETILGLLVLLVAVSFLIFVYNISGTFYVHGYLLKAVFTKVGGLQVGDDVRISGVKVGTVTSQTLDHVTFEAVVHISISQDVRLPKDTVAAIASEGLLGGRYMRLEPGHDVEFLVAGDTVAKTKDFRSLEEMVSEIMFFATQDGNNHTK